MIEEGITPSKPVQAAGGTFTYGIWELCQACWKVDPLERPSATRLKKKVSSLAKLHDIRASKTFWEELDHYNPPTNNEMDADAELITQILPDLTGTVGDEPEDTRVGRGGQYDIYKNNYVNGHPIVIRKPRAHVPEFNIAQYLRVRGRSLYSSSLN